MTSPLFRRLILSQSRNESAASQRWCLGMDIRDLAGQLAGSLAHGTLPCTLAACFRTLADALDEVKLP